MPLDKRLLGHRDKERISWELLDLDLSHVRWLNCLSGSGEITESIYTDIRASGHVTTVETDVDWDAHLVRPYYSFGDDPELSWPLGTFIPTTSRVQITPTGATCELQLYDRAHNLVQDKMDESYVANTGINPVWLAGEIARKAGIAQVAETPSPARLTGAMVWDFLSTKIKVCNDLLKAANYFGIFADEYGAIQLQPYVLPADRPIVHDFIDGETCVYLPNFELDIDAFNVPNKIALLGRLNESSHDDPPLRAVAINNDPTSRFSRVRRRRWIVDGDASVETTSQAALDGQAARMLAERATRATRYTVTTPFLPLPLHTGATFTNTRQNVAKTGVTITERRTQLETPVTQRIVLREVAP